MLYKIHSGIHKSDIMFAISGFARETYRMFLCFINLCSFVSSIIHQLSEFEKNIFQCLFLKDSIHFLSSRIERWRNENGTEPLFSDFVENNYHEIESQRPRVSSEASSEECKLDARCTFLPRQTKIWCRIFFCSARSHTLSHTLSPPPHTHTFTRTSKHARSHAPGHTHT